MSSLKKFIASLVVAVSVAMLSGFIAQKAVHSEPLEKDAVPIASVEEEKPAVTAEAESAKVKETANAVKEGAEESAEKAKEEVAAKKEEAGDSKESKSSDDSKDSIIALIAKADIEKGKKLSKKCTACHSFEKGGKNKQGPNLWGIVGAERGKKEGFKYSKAFEKHPGKWGYSELDEFLTKPKKYIKGTKMTFAGLKKIEDRANLLAWLRTMSDSPLPLDEDKSGGEK